MMFKCADLCVPDLVEVVAGESLLLNHEADDLLQLLHVLRLVEGVA